MIVYVFFFNTMDPVNHDYFENGLDWLVFVMENWCVIFEVGARYLNVLMNFMLLSPFL